jgi:putative transcriptional regulator
MTKENLIIKKNGEYKLTNEGVEFLHTNISELKEFVDMKITNLNIIDVCTAIAAEDLLAGEPVNLFMSNGTLVAKNKLENASGAKSSGEILYDTKKGHDVAVVNLSGIIEYDYGNLTILTLPSTTEGGSKLVSVTKFKDLLTDLQPERIAVYDLIGQVLLKIINRKPDIEFSSLPAAIEAAQKGFNVLLLTSTGTLSEIISQIENNNSQTKNIIHYSVISWKKIKSK